MSQYLFGSRSPLIDRSCFLATGSIVIGDVQMGAESSLWFNSVLRGDVHHIRVGRRTNIQDNCVGHVTSGTHPLIVGHEVTIGHRAVLHGCTIEDRALIGIGAVVMDGAHIGCESLIAAGSIVTPNSNIPSGVLAMGSPARVKRNLTSMERESLRESADNYVQLAKHYSESFKLL